MNEEKRAEINITIGKLLGFERFDPGKESGSYIQWVYPHTWKAAKGGQTETVLPDFLKLIDDKFYDILKVRGAVPKDYCTEQNPEFKKSLKILRREVNG